MRAAVIAALALLPACTSLQGVTDAIKGVETRAYDRSAKAMSELCAALEDSALLRDAMRDLSREVRQRGTNGPAGPEAPVEGLDAKTARGPGPVLVLWCERDAVPGGVWPSLIRLHPD